MKLCGSIKHDSLHNERRDPCLCKNYWWQKCWQCVCLGEASESHCFIFSFIISGKALLKINGYQAREREKKIRHVFILFSNKDQDNMFGVFPKRVFRKIVSVGILSLSLSLTSPNFFNLYVILLGKEIYVIFKRDQGKQKGQVLKITEWFLLCLLVIVY